MARAAAGAGGKARGGGRQRVYDSLRHQILRLELRPGEYLEETRLAEQTGASRTLVREALIQLGAEGLVSLLPNRGAQVAAIDLLAVREYFEALDLCQRAVTRWAALRREPADLAAIAAHRDEFEAARDARDGDAMVEANFAFHRAIARASRNAFIADTYFRIQANGLRLSRISLTYDFDDDYALETRLADIVAEHRTLCERIEACDADGAEAAAQVHAGRGRDRVAHNLTAIQSAEIAIRRGD